MENNHTNTPNNTNISSSQKPIAIVYKSKYGATKDYAKWLEKALIDRLDFWGLICLWEAQMKKIIALFAARFLTISKDMH